MNMFDVFHKGDNVVIQNNDILLNTSRTMKDVSSSSLLTNLNGAEIKIHSLF